MNKQIIYNNNNNLNLIKLTKTNAIMIHFKICLKVKKLIKSLSNFRIINLRVGKDLDYNKIKLNLRISIIFFFFFTNIYFILIQK